MEELQETYYLSEYFESIQGEGNYTGGFSLFLRFHFCNLTCTWCDTKYTWHKNSGPYKAFSTDELKKLIANRTPYHVIFTGGEPALYRLDKLVIPGKKYHVESNGTIIPTKPLEISLKDNTRITRGAMDEAIISIFNWVISPKLSNSKQKLDEQSLNFWAGKDYCIFKFVIRNFADLDEVESIVKQFRIDNKKIFIMLEGQTLESQLKPELVDMIMERGYNFSPRLQVMLWGEKRGK